MSTQNLDQYVSAVKTNGVRLTSTEPLVVAGTATFTGTVNLSAATVTSGAQAITSASANALVVGANGATNPVFNVDASTASVATGLQVKGAAAGSGVAVTVLSSGTDESVSIAGKGTGKVTIPSETIITAAAASNHVPLTVTQNDTTNNPVALAVNQNTSGYGLTVTGGSTGNELGLFSFTGTTAGGGNRAVAVSSTSATTAAALELNYNSASFAGIAGYGMFNIRQRHASATGNLARLENAGSGVTLSVNSTVSSNSAIYTQVHTVTQTITAGVSDAYAGSVELTPTYSAATAQTVTRHNYLQLDNVTLAGVGPAALTDAAVFRFNAAAGTHKAVDAATTKTTPGGVDAWVKVNVNGTILYMPAYTSKTA